MCVHLVAQSSKLVLVSSNSNIPPNDGELEFLTLAYDAFYDAYNQYSSGVGLTGKQKFALITRILSLYSECLQYEPIKAHVKYVEENRPPGEATVYRYLEMIRHILVHFNFYHEWNEVKFNRNLITWLNKHSRIDKFLSDFDGHDLYKWRIWDPSEKRMSYGYEIRFPDGYLSGKDIYLKDLIDEENGINFSLMMIKEILDSHVVRQEVG